MKFVRSDSPEEARSIASTRTLARRHLPGFLLGLLLSNLVILSIALGGLIVSVRVAAWIGLPALLAWNAWVLQRARSPRLSWVVKAGTGRVLIRLYVGSGKAWRKSDLPDVMVLEASEIASVSIRTIEVLLYGPRPKVVEWLVIEPSQVAVENISEQVPSFLWDTRRADWTAPYLNERVYWADGERRLNIGWKLYRPAVRDFLREVARECPSIAIGPEERSELDLNGIWHGYGKQPDVKQGRMLAQAKRLGFGPDCVRLLIVYRCMPFRECAPYLAELEREEIETEHSAANTT
jgi:hypothetical protein